MGWDEKGWGEMRGKVSKTEVIYIQSETENKHLHVPVLHEKAEESL